MSDDYGYWLWLLAVVNSRFITRFHRPPPALPDRP